MDKCNVMYVVECWKQSRRYGSSASYCIRGEIIHGGPRFIKNESKGPCQKSGCGGSLFVWVDGGSRKVK